MGIPRIYKVDEFPVKPDRLKLHEMAVEYAVEEFTRRGKIPFMWLMAVGNDVVWLETPWESDREKNLSVHAVKMFLDTFGSHSYAHMVEAWCASYPKDVDPETVPLPSTLPPNERDDIIMVLSFDKDDNQSSSRYLVSFRPNNNNLLGPRQDEQGKFEGRMGNLLLMQMDMETEAVG